MPQHYRQHVLSALGLRLVATVNRGMAAQLLARLRSDATQGRSELLRDVTAPVSVVLDSRTGPDQWSSVLGPDPRRALEVYSERHDLRQMLTSVVRDLGTALLTAGLAVAIIGDTAGSAVALALLAEQNDDARSVHNSLSESYPGLPPIPAAPLRDLVYSARRNAIGLDDSDSSEDLLPQADEMIDDKNTAHVLTPAEGDCADASTHASELLRRWDEVSDVAAAVASTLRHGGLPDIDNLDRIVAYVEEAMTVLTELRSELGEEVPDTRHGLQQAIDLLASRSAEAELDWLMRLAALSGPDNLKTPLGQVRAEATAAVDDPNAPRERLKTIWGFISLATASRSGGDTDYSALSEAHAAAQEAWPAMGPLLTAINFGAVTLPDAPESAEPSKSAEPAGKTLVPETGSPASEPSTGEPESSHTDGIDDNVLRSPSDVEQPATFEPPAADLSDLDTLLDAGAGASLAAISTPGRRLADKLALAAKPIQAEAETASPVRVEANSSRETGTVHIANVLLSDRRYGLAADLLEASGAPEPNVAARRLAACAAAITNPTGRLASAFAELAPKVERESLGDDRAGQLVALTAAARIALVAPSAGPAGVMLELLPCVSEQPALTEALEALADASRAGIVVLAEAANAVGTLAEAETAAADAATAAAALVTSAARRTIKYIPANGVYLAWMSPTGELGTLLNQVATNDARLVTTVRESVVTLRGKVQKSIDSTFASLRRTHSQRIVAGARTSLVQRWEEALELAGRWADLAERATERQAVMNAGAWQAGSLTKLRRQLAGVRAQALKEISSGEDAHAAALLLSEAFAICDGKVPEIDEPPLPFVLHRELLAARLTLDAESLLPDNGLSPAHIPALLEVAEQPAAEPSAVYESRAERGDHDLTAVLIAGVRVSNPSVAAALERKRGTSLPDRSSGVEAEVAELAKQIDAKRLAGTLDDQPWAALASRAVALWPRMDGPWPQPRRRVDFGRILASVTAIKNELHDRVQEKIASTRARIEERAASNTAVAANLDKLNELARKGDVASADEYLQTLLAGGTLPATEHQAEHLSNFFPVVAKAASERPHLLTNLQKALSAAPDDASAAALARIGLNVADLSKARRDAGRRALNAWGQLVGHNTGGTRKTDTAELLRMVLAQAGLEFTTIKVEQASTRLTGRNWLRLNSVTGTGEALTPALGSAMSPDGTALRVLLVKTAPTPATLIEWMSGEMADHTVLAIWLGGALSPADRRAIANAARGRPNPPLVVFDVAALAYLVCQPEPRRSTFAAIALPFSAANPYRDTPGDTPPEMFYGRTEELAAVIDLNGPSFVSGGRQLGKSALLRAAARRFNGSGHGRHAVLTSVFTVGGDGRPERIWGALWPLLARIGIVGDSAPTGDKDIAPVVYDSVMRWLEHDPSRALLILLDEADAFLDADAASRDEDFFVHVDWCRRLMVDSNRRVKVVFAGLHRTARFESLPNQPLSHFGKPISVGPLRPQHAQDLLIHPLAALGFTFADKTAQPARILAMANNMPALLQLFGEALVKHLAAQAVPADGPPQLITDADIDEVFADADLLAAFREKYVLTLNLDHRYLVIAYAVAEAAHERGIDASLSLNELSDIARQHWPAGFSEVGADDFRGLVTECVDLGVLALDSSRYRLRTPTVLRLLGTEDEVLDTLYTASERLVVPSPSDGGSYRRTIRSSRSPLTERQLGRLFDARREVLTVAGSAALGIDRVMAAVKAAHEQGAQLGSEVAQVHTVTSDGIKAAVSLAAGYSTLLLVDAQGITAAVLEMLLETADTAVHAARHDVTVAFVVTPANAAAWIKRQARIDLCRVDEPGLRMWCDEENLPFRDDQARAELLQATGGWPQAIVQAERLAANTGAAARSAKLLADLESWLHGDGGRGLVTAAGIAPGKGVLSESFRTVVTIAGADGDLVMEIADSLQTYVGTAALDADGFNSFEDVIAALVALGCFTVTDSGRLRPEPTTAAITSDAPAKAKA